MSHDEASVMDPVFDDDEDYTVGTPVLEGDVEDISVCPPVVEGDDEDI